MLSSPARERGVLLRESFSISLDPSVWTFPQWSPVNNPSFFGRTQIRQDLPVVENGVLRLRIDTFDTNGPGSAFIGSQITSRERYDLSAGGLAFEFRARLSQSTPGVVLGLFGYEFRSASAHDEIDFEILGNDAFAGANRVQTNIYTDEPLGAGHPAFLPVAGSLQDFHTYRIEWTPYRVTWLVDGAVVREITDHVPNHAQAVNANFWAPDTDWGEAYSSLLQPAATAGQNVTLFAEIDDLKVARLVSPILVTDFADGTQIKDALSGAIVQTLPPLDVGPLQFLHIGDTTYGRNLATAKAMGLDPSQLRDYGGNDMGAHGGWRMIGLASVRAAEEPSYILVNPENRRWAEVAGRRDGLFDFANHGLNGDTRIVGNYEDPLIALGLVARGTSHDSQTRFMDDIHYDRLAVLGSADYDRDGFVDLFFKLTNHHADHHDDVYLRAILHHDGNILYANYMLTSQFTDWMSHAGAPQAAYDGWLTRI